MTNPSPPTHSFPFVQGRNCPVVFPLREIIRGDAVLSLVLCSLSPPRFEPFPYSQSTILFTPHWNSSQRNCPYSPGTFRISHYHVSNEICFLIQGSVGYIMVHPFFSFIWDYFFSLSLSSPHFWPPQWRHYAPSFSHPLPL